MSDAGAGSSQAELRRGIGLVAAIGSGVAMIVGAGIYVLMGEAAGKAGNALWLSFTLAGAAAFFTGLSYAELSAMFPRAAAAYTYTKEAFGHGTAYVVGWLTLAAQIVAVSAVSLGFGGYVEEEYGFSRIGSALLLTAASAALCYRGVRESVSLGAGLAILEVGGLVVVIALGVPHLGDVNYLELASGTTGIFTGASLLFFAFLGFEEVANLAEEIREPGRNLPIAILVSGGISAALYILVAMAAVSILGWAALSASRAPLAAIARATIGEQGAAALAIIALIATSSTVLIGMVAATRNLYGMAMGGSLPQVFARVHPRLKTPWVATLAVAAISVLGIIAGDVGAVAQVTNFTILLAFVAVNLALIWLRRTKRAHPRPFRVPCSIRGVPIPPVLGALTASLLLVSTGLVATFAGSGVVLAALVAYFLKSRLSRRGHVGIGMP